MAENEPKHEHEHEHAGHEAPGKSKGDPMEKEGVKAQKHGNKIALIGILVGIGVAIYLYMRSQSSSSSSTIPGTTIPNTTTGTTGNGGGGSSGGGARRGRRGKTGKTGKTGPPGPGPGTGPGSGPGSGPGTGPPNTGVTTGASSVQGNIVTPGPGTRAAAITSAFAGTGISPRVIGILASSPPSNPSVGTVQPSISQLSNPNVIAMATQMAQQSNPQSAPAQANAISTAAVNPNIATAAARTISQEQGTPYTVNGLTYANKSVYQQYHPTTHHAPARHSGRPPAGAGGY